MPEAGGSSFRSLRGRFLFYFLVLSILSLLLFSSLFAYFLWRQMKREENRARDQLIEQSQEMARDLELGIMLGQQFPETPLAGSERIAQLLRLEGKLIDAVSVVVDESGRVVAPMPLAPRVPRQLDTELLAESEIETVETSLGRLGDVFVVTIPLDTLNSEFHNLAVIKRLEELTVTPSGELMRYIIIAGGAALALSIILALYLSNYVLKPLHGLTQAAWNLAHGDMESRVQVAGRDEIAELSRYFNYMADRLQQGSQLQKDFVANVSHEIRTPLTSIEGFSQALLDGVVEKEGDRERYLNIILSESRRLKRVLVQLLALSRLDAGAWILQPGDLSIRAYLEDTGERFRHLVEERGVELEVEAASGLPVIKTDRDALDQVLTNLLDNAIKFTPEGGRVVLAGDPLPGGGARIQVRDNGQGIPPDRLEHVFERFVRVEPSRSQQHGGSGLGLAVCKELVNLLGGRITVWSQPGRGTVFTLELPPAPPDLPAVGGGQ